MTTPTSKSRNGIGSWIVIAMICGGASGGATWLRPVPSSHNPNITTTDWNEMCRNVDNLQRDLAKLATDLREVVLRLPQQPPSTQP